MSTRNFPYPRALVTGASAGIGAALAARLAEEGVRELTLVARRADRLQDLAAQIQDQTECQVRCVVADLTDPSGVARLIAAVPDVDLLVNNAGAGSFGLFHRLDPEREAAIVALNCGVPVALARHHLPGMVERGQGCVLNIGSGQSFGAMPYMSTYAATKAFLLHWAEGVRAELAGTGVHMVTVCPGAITTEFNRAAGIPEGELAVISLVRGSLDGVVSACVGAIRSNHGLSIPGARNWLAVWLGRLSPRALASWVLARLLRSGAEAASARSPTDPQSGAACPPGPGDAARFGPPDP